MATDYAKSEKPDIVLVDDRDALAANHDLEKSSQVRIIDNFTVLGLSEEDAAFYDSFTEKQRKQIIRKVIQVIPYLTHKYMDFSMLTA
jgi:hypothetical protein